MQYRSNQFATANLDFDNLLTPAEAAEKSHYSVEWIRRAYKSGELQAFQTRPNGRVWIPLSALEQWLSRPAAPPSATEATDWAAPARPCPPDRDFVVCDQYTGDVPVHASRLAEFFAHRARSL